MALRIEDYALIGDRRGAGLVGRNGSIDWLCLPRFDSPACLAALLGTEEHGFWQFEPVGDYTVERRYVGDSAVLETTFRTEDGEATLTDLMPHTAGRADVVRVLWGVRGRVRFTHTWRVRMDYGKVRPWVRRAEAGGEPVITAIAGPDTLVLRGPDLPVAVDHTHQGEVEVTEGHELRFSMTWIPSHHPLEDLAAHEDVINKTVDADEGWVDARATGTTATAGSATPRSPSAPSPRLASPTRRCCGATGCCAPSRATPRTCRSCTASTAPAACPRSS